MCRLIVLLICTLFVKIICSQPELKFIHYKQSDGLVYNDVLSICQDSIGFMWFGTKQGVSRFDGMKFSNFKAGEKPGTIGEGWVKKIIADNNGGLWIAIPGEKNNLLRFNYDTEVFEDYSAVISTQIGIRNQSYHTIFHDKSGEFWLGTENGPIIFDPEKSEVRYFNEIRKKYLLFNTNNPGTINDIFEDEDSRVWLATSTGIYIYIRAKKSFIHITHDAENKNSLSSSICNCIYCDTDNNIWIGTHNGLNKVSLKETIGPSLKFEKFIHDPKDENSISDNLIYDIDTDNNGNLLIATVHGLCLLEKKTGRIFRYLHDELNSESISSNIVRTIYKDKYKNIWIGTSLGICKLKSSGFIKTFTFSSYRNSLSHNKVKNFHEVSDSEILIATPKGIDIFNRETRHFDFIIPVNQKSNGLSGPPILLYPYDGDILIGTYKGGTSLFIFENKTISPFTINNDPSLLNTVPVVLKDSKGNLWINDHGLDLFVIKHDNNELLKIPQVDEDMNTLSSYLVTSIMEDTDSNIWVTTNEGLCEIIDAEKGICKRYLYGTKTNHVIEGNDKNIWIATEKGLYQMDKEAKKLTVFNEQKGLPGEVFSIIEDSAQNLWLSNSAGISQFSHSGDSTYNIITFRKEDGLPSVDFLLNSCEELSDGTILFGSTEGFCMFHPSEMAYDTITPEIVFTDFKVGQKHIFPGQQINGQVILDKSISKSKSLVINHNNNDFTIEFAGLHSNIPQNNQYYYMLEKEGSTVQEWTYVSSQKREAKFMNLPSGEYNFKVKCANGYGIWNKKGATIQISVLAPWWKTTWFVAICITFLLVLFYLILKQRTINLQRQKQKLEHIVNIRTLELQEVNTILEEQKQETEQMALKLHEADQEQLRFFTNISHEFRTPLTLILGPMQRILNIGSKDMRNTEKYRIDAETLSNYHKIIYKNANRLLKLINQILEIRKYSQASEEIKRTNNNISEFIREIVNVFSPMAEAKRIQLSFDLEHLTLNKNDFWFDPDIMEKILYNLVSNAIKYTNEGGEISIAIDVAVETLHATSLQHQLAIKITDTGIGIKPNNLNKIFNRFYRDNENTGEEKIGTGIGLAFTKELVITHEGHISVESEYGKGTVFTLSFPFRKNDIEPVSGKAASINLKYTKTLINETKLISDYDKYPIGKSSYNQKLKPPKHADEKSYKVLVVEDNTDLQSFIENELYLDYNVILASHGKEGLETARNIKPDIIISDIMMPEMDGIAMCEKLKNDYLTSHIPVIFLTAKAGEENVIAGLKTGGDDYISKPFHIDILKLKIKNLLKSREILKEKFSSSIIIKPEELSASSNDELFLKKAFEIVEENLSRADFTNDEFIRMIGHGRTVVYEKIKALTNQSVGEFIRTIRLKKAAMILLQGDKTVSEVADLTGFKYRESFYKSFTTMFKKSPTQFIKDNIDS